VFAYAYLPNAEEHAPDFAALRAALRTGADAAGGIARRILETH